VFNDLNYNKDYLMNNKTQIKKMTDSFMEIAKLHDPKLENAAEMPNWNACHLILRKLEFMVNANRETTTIMEKAENLSPVLEEMKNEITKMVSSDDLSKAKENYEKIQENLGDLINNLKNESHSRNTP
jgi:cell fate (sporulation/competence/biofilm development) regulator YlbF (YheA/YmcA/DUF963 family)